MLELQEELKYTHAFDNVQINQNETSKIKITQLINDPNLGMMPAWTYMYIYIHD